MKFYAVRKGRNPGIYRDWATARQQVTGYKGAIYKSFPTVQEALEYMKKDEAVNISREDVPKSFDAYAYVDGSFNAKTGVYGFGGFLIHNGEKTILQGHGNDKQMKEMRNVAGEILGAQAAVNAAMTLGLKNLVIYYDYAGIEQWATGGWAAKKPGTIAYRNFMQKCQEEIILHFVKVKGHTGIEGNEEADQLAKEACGIAIRQS